MSLESLHSVVWKGASIGEFTPAQIRRKLSSGEISRMHRVWVNGAWISVGEFLDAKRSGELEIDAARFRAREQQLRDSYEAQLRQAKDKHSALASQLDNIQHAANRAANIASLGTASSPEQGRSTPGASYAPSTDVLGQLRCISGPDEGTVLSVGNDSRTFGSSPECTIVSRDPSVAAQHASLKFAGGRLQVDRISPSGVIISNGAFVGTADTIGNGGRIQLGSSFWQFESFSLDEQTHTGGLADAVSRLVGVDSIGGFSFSETFSHVFKTHSDEETELNIACGTTATTPTIDCISPAFPQPWMFIRTLAFSLGAFWLLKFTWGELGNNPKLIPGLIALGSLATPVSMLVLFFEANKPKNVSVYQLIKLFGIGGVLSLLFTHILHPWIGSFIVEHFHLDPESGSEWIAGITEEPAKMFVLFWMINKQRYSWLLNGLLFGAAVGSGFAVFETAGYAFNALLSGEKINYEGMFLVLFIRGLLSSFSMHVVWSAIVGAGVWRAKRGRPFTANMLLSWPFGGPFLIAVSMHSLWNSPLDFGLLLGIFPTKLLLVGLVGWIVVIGLIREGLREIAAARNQSFTTAAQPSSAQHFST